MLQEAGELSFEKEDKRRDDAFAKLKKSQANAPPSKKTAVKTDIPFESVTYGFKQELFETCYKRITKRVALGKKKKKANNDLKNV